MIDDDRLYLTHIGECLERIHRYTGGSKDRYTGSELVRDAVERNLETLCDAMGMLSVEAMATEPSIPWASIKAFRNRLAHGYLSVDPNLVWRVIQDDLPGLARLPQLGVQTPATH